MGLSGVGDLSLGQWIATVAGWNKTHGGPQQVAPPSDDEFDKAVMAARGADLGN